MLSLQVLWYFLGVCREYIIVLSIFFPLFMVLKLEKIELNENKYWKNWILFIDVHVISVNIFKE